MRDDEIIACRQLALDPNVPLTAGAINAAYNNSLRLIEDEYPVEDFGLLKELLDDAKETLNRLLANETENQRSVLQTKQPKGLSPEQIPAAMIAEMEGRAVSGYPATSRKRMNQGDNGTEDNSGPSVKKKNGWAKRREDEKGMVKNPYYYSDNGTTDASEILHRPQAIGQAAYHPPSSMWAPASLQPPLGNGAPPTEASEILPRPQATDPGMSYSASASMWGAHALLNTTVGSGAPDEASDSFVTLAPAEAEASDNFGFTPSG